MSDFNPPEGTSAAPLPTRGQVSQVAIAENKRNREYIKLTDDGAITAIQIGRSATFNGTPAWLLSSEEKKKFENRVLFMYLPELTRMPIITYG